MRPVGGAGAGRSRWVVAFVVLLLGLTAVPVFAEEPPLPPAPTEAELASLPDAQDVGEALKEAEREEETRRAWLASPEAVQEREASRFAFAGLDTAAAEELLSAVFAEQLAQLNEDPARVLSDAQLLSSSDETSATINDEGNGLLLESSMPVQAEDEQGDLGKVDLSLE